MNVRSAVAGILAAIALAILAGTIAHAQTLPNQQVPLAVPLTVTGANPSALQATINATNAQVAAEATAQTAGGAAPQQVTPTAPAAASSNPVVIGNTGLISTLFTTILQDAWSGIANAANEAQTIGVRIYIFIALISVILAMIPVVFSHEPSHYLKFVVERVVEMSIVVAVISNTWTGVGWFPALIAAGANLGMFIGGNGAMGGSPTFNVTSGWSLNVLPGNILNFGGAMFSDIISATIFTPHGILSAITGVFNGTLIIQIIIAVLGLLSAIWAFFGFAYAAFRMLLTVLKTYLLSPLSLLQGLLGSKRLASYGGGYFAGALVLAVEVCLTMIIVGLFYNVVNNEHTFFQQLLNANSPSSNCQTLFNNPSSLGACLVSVTGLTTTPISIGGLVVIDSTIGFFLAALRDVPRLAANAIQGQFTASAQEAIQAMKSSPSPFSKLGGFAAGMTDSYAREGAITATAKGVSTMVGKAVELGAMVAIGAYTGGAGTVAGAATAAGKGALLGGGEGAIASGLGNVIFGKFAESTRGGAPAEENTITSGVGDPEGDTGEEEETTTRGTQRTSAQKAQDAAARTDNEGADAREEGDNTEGAASDTDATATQHVTMEREVDSDPQSQEPATAGVASTDQTVTQHTSVIQELTQQIKELTAAMRSAPVGAGGGAPAPAPASAGAGGHSAGSSDGGALGGVAEISDSMSLGRMFTHRALYMSARQPNPPPLPKEDSATMQFTLVR